MDDLCKKLQNSQAIALEAFKVEMQQEMARQMTIITEMQSKLATSIQDIVNNDISQIQAAAFQAAPAIIPPTPPQPVGGTYLTPTTPKQSQGISSPLNLAFSLSGIKQGSAADAAEK
eukprot:2962429-Ditylum_brightwellii.AAC.1